MIAIQGRGVSGGIAIAPIVFYQRDMMIEDDTIYDADVEWQRFIKTAQEELAKLIEKAHQDAGEEASLLFETHQMMLEDEDYQDAIEAKIKKEGSGAASAVREVTKQFAQMFRAMDDRYMQAREADIKDIGMRLIRILNGHRDTVAEFDELIILAADDLAPSETIQLDKSKIAGFLLSGGAAAGHTAILARTMGIPAVIGIKDALLAEYEGRTAILDGGTGSVIVDPNEDTLSRYRKRQDSDREKRQWMHMLKGKENRTRDGQAVRIYCNIS